MDGTLVQAPVRGQSLCLAEEGLGRNPTNRGRSGSKIHCHVDQSRIPLGVVLVGAHVHDSRLVSSTVVAEILPRPAPTPDQPQHLCLDQGYDYARVEAKVNDQGYIPHIRRIGEEKMADAEKTQPPLGGAPRRGAWFAPSLADSRLRRAAGGLGVLDSPTC